MDRQDTQVTTSRAFVVWLLVLSLPLSLGGYYVLAHADELTGMLIGGALLSAFPISAIAICFLGAGGTGPCPVCGEPIKLTFGANSFLLCRACGSYLEAANNKLNRKTANCLASDPVFAVPLPWTDLGLVLFPNAPMSVDDVISDLVMTKKEGARLLPAKWPMRCCVCGKSPRRMETHARTVVYRGYTWFYLRDKQVTLVAQGIPYCEEHTNGVRFDRVHFADAGESSFGLLFRSLAYRAEFWKTNPWRWTDP